MSLFSTVPTAPVDPILGVSLAYKADTNENKVDLGIGAYRDEEGRPTVFRVVRKVEKQLAESNGNHEYLGIDGLPELKKLAQKLIFGSESQAMSEGRIVTAQSLSGTGALRIGAEFLKKFLPVPVLIPDPTWSNHIAIFGERDLKVIRYRYFDPKTNGLDFAGLLQDLKAAPDGSVVLLHVCAHNPTGVDPTQDQWRQIAQLCKEKKFVPFFDSAYQGFATGDIDGDAFSIRHFEKEGFELFLAQSFAKNFGLYGERVGTFSMVVKNAEVANSVLSQLKLIIRPMYSNPPQHGALVVSKVLGDPNNYQEWLDELKAMSARIQEMRRVLYETLKAKGTPGSWNHIIDQIGMFTYTGLSASQCEQLIEVHHIHMLKNGRISMAGLNSKNVKYVAEAIHSVVTSQKL